MRRAVYEEKESLRDRIAMAALAGMLAKDGLRTVPEIQANDSALAYRYADAMLAARVRK